MSTSEEEQRRERLRALREIKEQAANSPPRAVVATPTSGAATPSPDGNQRGAKLRELLQRRQAANPGGEQAGGGTLLRALAERGGLGGGGGLGGAGGGLGGGGGGGFLRQALANRAGNAAVVGAGRPVVAAMAKAPERAAARCCDASRRLGRIAAAAIRTNMRNS